MYELYYNTENNNDIETNRFANIITEQGIPTHVNDKIIDQDITYYHKPDSIASGFYTAERRIIPLKDKLFSMDTSIQELRDEVMGTSAEDLLVSIVNGDVTNKLYPMQDNYIAVESYKEFGRTTEKGEPISTESQINGTYDYNEDTGVVSTILNLVLTNTSDHTMKVYSMFPGSRSKIINELKHSKFPIEEYCNGEGGVWIKISNDSAKENGYFNLQTCNQFITFRIKDAFNYDDYYSEEQLKKPDIINVGDDVLEDVGMVLYPMVRDKYGLCLDSDNKKSYITIAPKSEIVVPIIVEYKLPTDNNSDGPTSITKTMSFDIRTSLYNDPINYTFSVTAKQVSTTQDKLIYTNRRNYGIKDIKNGGWIKYQSTEIK